MAGQKSFLTTYIRRTTHARAGDPTNGVINTSLGGPRPCRPASPLAASGEWRVKVWEPNMAHAALGWWERQLANCDGADKRALLRHIYVAGSAKKLLEACVAGGAHART